MTELTASFVDDFYDAVNETFRYSLFKAAKRITREEIAYFPSLLKEMEESIERNDFEFYINGVSALMQKVLQIAQNRIVEDIVNDLMPSIERFQFAATQITPSSTKESLNYLREIYEHLSNNAYEKAANAYLNFSSISRDILLNHLTPKVASI